MADQTSESGLVLPPERKKQVTVPEGDLPTVSIDPNRMVMVAIERNYDPGSLKTLMEIRDKIVAEQARMAFYKARSRFQQSMPEIPRTAVVYNKPRVKGGESTVRYRYAPADTIIKSIQEGMGENGLSFTGQTTIERDETSQYKTWVKGTITVFHEAGHSEPSSFSVPVMQSEFMTYGQSVTSARTTALRVALSNALGLITVDPDDDGASASVSDVSRVLEQAKEFEVEAKDLLSYGGAASWGDVSDEVVKKMENAVSLLRDGATAYEIFGGRGASGALAVDSGPTPADVYAQLDEAKTKDQLDAAVDLMDDALRTPGHKRIGELKRKEALRRIKGDGGRGRRGSPDNRAADAFGGAQ